MAAPTPAVAALDRLGVPYVVHNYAHDGGPVTGVEAAERLGLDLDRVYKTLVVSLGASHAIAVVPVSQRLDTKATAKALGAKKAELVASEVAERLSRSVVGAISPIGFPRPLPTVLDATVDDHETVFVSAGRRGLELELSAGALVRATAAVVAPICA